MEHIATATRYFAQPYFKPLYRTLPPTPAVRCDYNAFTTKSVMSSCCGDVPRNACTAANTAR